jgi:glutathione synthase/RimK-type ligase-like ATP-grasp enzyme
MAPTEVSAREAEIAVAAAAACQLAVAAVDIVGEATAPRISEVDPLPGIMTWEDEMDLPAAAAWIGAAIAAR